MSPDSSARTQPSDAEIDRDLAMCGYANTDTYPEYSHRDLREAYQAGFDAAAPAPGTVTVPAPRVPFPGPSTDAHFMREAASHLQGGFQVGGSNLTATVIKLLIDVANAMEPAATPAPVPSPPSPAATAASAAALELTCAKPLFGLTTWTTREGLVTPVADMGPGHRAAVVRMLTSQVRRWLTWRALTMPGPDEDDQGAEIEMARTLFDVTPAAVLAATTLGGLLLKDDAPESHARSVVVKEHR